MYGYIHMYQTMVVDISIVLLGYTHGVPNKGYVL